MPKVVFVILHYLTSDDTIQCVKSIEDNVEYGNYEIIIVDNASNNNSFSVLEREFKRVNNIYLIKNNENLGFAKGNNIGYKFAKNNFHAEFIIMINNDIFIKDHSFIVNILNIYNKNQFHIMGPDIISIKDGGHQNPVQVIRKNKNDVERSLIKYKSLLIMNYLQIQRIKELICMRKNPINNNEFVSVTLENVPLHGSCIIFSKDFINNMDYAFYPKTFLYVEEDILFYICRKNKLKTIYNPDIQVFHKEDSSTDKALTKEYSKKRFVYKNVINSLKAFKILLEEEG